MPFGGKYQLTPTQVMAATMPALNGQCDDLRPSWPSASIPYFTEQNPYLGATAAVIESVSKLVAAGCDFETAYLTFQEYFERLGKDPKRLGQAAVRPARRVHRAGRTCASRPSAARTPCPARSMSMDVPPTLVSFAIAPQDDFRSDLA